MRRLFLKGLLADEVTIAGGDAHHLLYAMRAKAGDEVVLVDDAGQVGRMELTGFTADTVTMRLIERLAADTESPLTLVLAQCLPKGDKLELIVQKAVELGAASIQPLASRNCVVRYDAKKAAAKEQRWQKIAGEAAKQCGRTRLPDVRPVRPLADWLRERQAREDAALLFCYENESQQPLKAVLRALPAAVREITLLIGPEGGFTLPEADAIAWAGGVSVTLGPRILRVETAAIAALAAVQYERGDLGSGAVQFGAPGAAGAETACDG